MAPIVHQALHGYSDGHRLIASSLSLSNAHARTMVVMSDLSGPGVKPDSTGYLTGYPLEGTGKYVLARTWAAPEMQRPGCVWTHSLIIDNADLATLQSADGLRSAFRRPTGPPQKSEYNEPVLIQSESRLPFFASRDRAWKIVNSLYAAPEQIILVDASEAEEDEQLIAAIWMQQWPRLRRAFGFCSLAGIDRSGKGIALDLQFVRSADRHVRAKFPNSVTASDVLMEPDLEPLMADLEGHDGARIREFLRKTGGDVEGGRRAMLPLCQLHAALITKQRPDFPSAVEALGHLDLFGASQARSVRTLIANRAIESIEDVDDRVFDFVVDTFERCARESDHTMAIDRLAEALWRRSPTQFLATIDAHGFVGRASTIALRTLDASDVMIGLRDNPQVIERVVHMRPDLLHRVDFWSIPNVDEELAANVDASAAGRVASALLAAGRGGPAVLLTELADPSELASALQAGVQSSALDVWLKALGRNPTKTAPVLVSGLISNRSILIYLARASDPEAVPNEYGQDPWLIAVHAAPELVGQEDEDFLAAFLLSRAIGHTSRSKADLICFSYATLYRALQESRLPNDVERMVTSRLDRGGWLAWDNCARLRATVVGRFVDLHLDPETFGRLTGDGELAIPLIDEAARTGRGRRYLEEVRNELKGAGEKWARARADYIADKIK